MFIKNVQFISSRGKTHRVWWSCRWPCLWWWRLQPEPSPSPQTLNRIFNSTEPSNKPISTDHFAAEVVDSLHLSGLQGQFAHLGSGPCCRAVYLDLHHLSLDHLRLLPYPHSNTLPAEYFSSILIPELLKAHLKAWVRASVLLISRLKISLAAIAVKGVSLPRAWQFRVL